MSKATVRKGGTTFYPNQRYTYEVEGMKPMAIPESDLYDLACDLNMTKLVKDALSVVWVQRFNESRAAAKKQSAPPMQCLSHEKELAASNSDQLQG